LALGLLALACAALIAPLPAPGKDGVKATLTTSIRLDAPAGSRLRVAWTLTYADADGKVHLFGAGGVFVRLLSASGAGAETAFAHGTQGRYGATVIVPRGGIRDIRIGIRGWTSNGRRADVLFPITNDPVLG
jgi:hypothetical protein